VSSTAARICSPDALCDEFDSVTLVVGLDRGHHIEGREGILDALLTGHHTPSRIPRVLDGSCSE
jgi:hypothetical protein